MNKNVTLLIGGLVIGLAVGIIGTIMLAMPISSHAKVITINSVTRTNSTGSTGYKITQYSGGLVLGEWKSHDKFCEVPIGANPSFFRFIDDSGKKVQLQGGAISFIEIK